MLLTLFPKTVHSGLIIFKSGNCQADVKVHIGVPTKQSFFVLNGLFYLLSVFVHYSYSLINIGRDLSVFNVFNVLTVSRMN